ncbi:unnamed protein product [Mycena citricolor]|uniref:HotDog ACOT-type domain-containing protein n=1 Tax=Mycena citricolor TaxID=2018698 RepID=A0AAD2JZQ6_9AGAR|nr:unnamed protein product [Mycena citricolor]
MRPSPRLRAFVQPRLCSLPARTQRLFSTSNLARNAATLQQTTVAKETRDIDEIDKLLASIRMKANPAYNSIMPMRVPALWAESVLHAEDHTASATRPKRNDSLVPRRMHDSYCELVLPFSDPTFLEGYTNVHGGIRMGKIMEHLDSLAGSISYKHVLGPDVQSLGSIQDVGFYMVTASVDRLDMLCPLEPSRDVRISGQVMYTGKSSMEIAVKVETISGGAEQTVLLGRFSMVCRDAVTHKARTINPLIISTPDEEALHTRGEEIKNGRRSQALKSLARVPPSSDEAELLHAFMLKYGQDLSQGSHERVWMGDTKLDRCMLMFPQERKWVSRFFPVRGLHMSILASTRRSLVDISCVSDMSSGSPTRACSSAAGISVSFRWMASRSQNLFPLDPSCAFPRMFSTRHRLKDCTPQSTWLLPQMSWT